MGAAISVLLALITRIDFLSTNRKILKCKNFLTSDTWKLNKKISPKNWTESKQIKTNEYQWRFLSFYIWSLFLCYTKSRWFKMTNVPHESVQVWHYVGLLPWYIPFIKIKCLVRGFLIYAWVKMSYVVDIHDKSHDSSPNICFMCLKLNLNRQMAYKEKILFY